MQKIFFVVVIFLSSGVFSQDLSENYAKYIDTVDLRRHLTILASDEFEGRETGTEGQRKTAKYIQSQFSNMELQDPTIIKTADISGTNYYQTFNLLQKVKSGKVDINGKSLNYPRDFGFNGLYQSLNVGILNPVYIKEKDLINSKRDFSNEYLCVEIKNYTSFNSDFYSNVKCKGIIFILEEYDSRYFINYKTDGLAMIQANPKTPYLFFNKKSLPKNLLKGITSTMKLMFSFDANLNYKPSYVETRNVIGFVEGSDPELRNEIIVISAHHDHIGVENGKIFNGADDNGSGTSGLLEIAEAFQMAKKDGNNPKRSILFLSVTGEEMGLFGSAYYASNPTFPLKNTIADLNIDMIGRTTKESEKEKFSVYVIGSNMLSDDLHQTQELANKQFSNLDLDYKYNDVNEPLRLYYRSDHYNFAKNGIPSIFYFGGFHDDYHQETDEISKINFEKIKQISTFVFHTAWMLGNADNRPAVNH